MRGKGRKKQRQGRAKPPYTNPTNTWQHSPRRGLILGLRRVRNHSGERKTQKNETPPEGGDLISRGFDGNWVLATPNFVESGLRVKRKRMFRANGRYRADLTALSPSAGSPLPEGEPMSRVATALPNHLRPRREKCFGDGYPRPLDRNAKARIKVFARALTKRTEARKHYGALTAKMLAVLEALALPLPQRPQRALLPLLRNHCHGRRLRPLDRGRGDQDA